MVVGSSNDQLLHLTPAQDNVISISSWARSTSHGFLGNLDTQQQAAFAMQRGCWESQLRKAAEEFLSQVELQVTDISDSPLKLHIKDLKAVEICDYKAKKHHSSSGVQKYYLARVADSFMCVSFG